MGRKLTLREVEQLDAKAKQRIQKCRRYYAANRDALRVQVREYQRTHREAIIERKKNTYYTEAAHRKYLDKTYGKGAADHYYAQLTKQHGKCAGCGLVPVRRLAQDHYKDSGQLRGLLCATYCNRILGYAMESPEVLRRLADYLEWWQRDHF